jgi:Orsellinic acid/F9775 biosynthesis cluster protein D
MEQLTKNKFINFYKPYSLLLCLECRTALPPLQSSIKSHFRGKHKLTIAELKSIIDFYFSINPRVTINDPQSIGLPSDYSLPISCLQTFRGYSCNACPYRTINEKNATTHQTHSKHKLGPGEKGWKAVTLQTFSRGGRSRYWIVDINNQHNGITGG